jgi:hypothetical protein
MVDKHRPFGMQDGKPMWSLDTHPQWHEHALRHVFSIFVRYSRQKSHRHVMLFRIEIATYRDECVRFAIEKTLGEKPSFECLPLPPLGREELTLRPGAARNAIDSLTRVGDKHGARRAKVKVDDMKGNVARQSDFCIEERTVPLDFNRWRL